MGLRFFCWTRQPFPPVPHRRERLKADGAIALQRALTAAACASSQTRAQPPSAALLPRPAQAHAKALSWWARGSLAAIGTRRRGPLAAATSQTQGPAWERKKDLRQLPGVCEGGNVLRVGYEPTPRSARLAEGSRLARFSATHGCRGRWRHSKIPVTHPRGRQTRPARPGR